MKQYQKFIIAFFFGGGVGWVGGGWVGVDLTKSSSPIQSLLQVYRVSYIQGKPTMRTQQLSFFVTLDVVNFC